MPHTNRFCRKCKKPYYDASGASELFCLCPECMQKQVIKTQGRSAYPYPHNVRVCLLDSRELAIRN